MVIELLLVYPILFLPVFPHLIVPVAVIAFFLGYKTPRGGTPWFLFALGAGFMFLVYSEAVPPLTYLGDKSGLGMALLALPFVMPMYLFVPYGFGQIFRYIKNRRKQKNPAK